MYIPIGPKYFILIVRILSSSDVTYALFLEAINMLVILLSVQMFDPDASSNSVIYQIVMTGKW